MNKLPLELEELDNLSYPMSDFWEGFLVASGTILAAAGVVAAIAALT